MHRRGLFWPPFLVEDSYIAGTSAVGADSIVSNVISSLGLQINNGIILHQLPLNGDEGETEYVTRVYGVKDNPKDLIDYGTYCNVDWRQWLGALPESVEEQIWEDVEPEERTLWNARIFPVCTDRDESLRLALWLQNPPMHRHQLFINGLTQNEYPLKIVLFLQIGLRFSRTKQN